jgi:hypothetical protein
MIDDARNHEREVVNSEYSHSPKLRLIASKTGNVSLDDVWLRKFSDRRNVKIGAALPDGLFGPKNTFVLMQKKNEMIITWKSLEL